MGRSVLKGIAALALLGTAAAAAAPTRGAAAGDRAAWAVAREVEAHYRHAGTLEALFLETYSAGEADIRVESGTVYFRRPGLMRWNYESPERKLFLVDGHHVWFYIPADHAASRTSVRQSADWRTPFSLLTGKAHFKDLCQAMTLVPSQGGPGSPPAGHVVLDCEPKDRHAFLDARIEVDSARRLVRVVVKQPGEIATEVRFAHWQENLPLKKSLFQFQPPPGVTIVDQQAIAGSGR
jgi:outer membrane lipoprotein carrier protein